MKSEETNSSTVDTNDRGTIEMLDALGYLRNGSVIWTRVPKDFDMDFNRTFPGGSHFNCAKAVDGAPFDYVSTNIIEQLLSREYVQCRIELDSNNANNKLLFCQLEDKGEGWYLEEYPRWREYLHHELT